eukprot:scaffold194962_cov22-Tisochrysis_lutea.AAC.2
MGMSIYFCSKLHGASAATLGAAHLEACTGTGSRLSERASTLAYSVVHHLAWVMCSHFNKQIDVLQQCRRKVTPQHCRQQTQSFDPQQVRSASEHFIVPVPSISLHPSLQVDSIMCLQSQSSASLHTTSSAYAHHLDQFALTTI